MNDTIFEKVLMRIFWSLMLLASGIKLTMMVDVRTMIIIGYVMIAIAVVFIIETLMVSIIITRES